MSFESAQRFYSQYAIPTLTRLKAQKVVRGDYSITPQPDGSFRSVFQFLAAWEVEIKFRYGTALDRFILRASGVADEDRKRTLNTIHSFHFHPDIRDSDLWGCVDEYERGPHLHLYFERDTKLISLATNPVPLDSFLLFLVGRHHKTKMKHIQKVLGLENVQAFGLAAIIA
ncbi:hypothetical protein WDW86_16705 [Bdellovibrionota bacterium FG-2]